MWQSLRNNTHPFRIQNPQLCSHVACVEDLYRLEAFFCGKKLVERCTRGAGFNGGFAYVVLSSILIQLN
jgi:hypothetical protein